MTQIHLVSVGHLIVLVCLLKILSDSAESSRSIKTVNICAATSINITTGASIIYLSVIHSLCEVIMIMESMQRPNCKSLMLQEDVK